MTARPKEVKQIVADPVAAAVAGISDLASTHLHVTIDLPGRLEPELLHQAIRAISLAAPELAGRLRWGWWRSCWEIDPAAQWLLDEHHGVDLVRAAELEAGLFARPFRPYGTLPLELVLLHLEQHDRLLLRVSHLLADGGGTKNLLYRLATAYRELRADPGWLPPAAARRRHPLTRLLAAARTMPWRRLLHGLLDELRTLLSDPFVFVPMPCPGPDPGPDRFAALHLGRERVARLQAGWKEHGVTLNDLALVAMARALERLHGDNAGQPGKVGLVVTADLRRYLPAEEDLGNLSSLCSLLLSPRPLPAAPALVERVVAATRRWKRGGTGLANSLLAVLTASLLPHGAVRWIGRSFVGMAIRSGKRVALTNIGPIDERRLDFGDGSCQAARIISPVAHPPMLITALTGCAGALDFTLSWQQGSLPPEQPGALLDALDAELEMLEARRAEGMVSERQLDRREPVAAGTG
ncbi:MAG: hypothetical protein FJ125_09840 [Deltaproteobacteria bacterium]|nr:hypothetical protein [Deltaproteobacteria bacterium]